LLVLESSGTMLQTTHKQGSTPFMLPSPPNFPASKAPGRSFFDMQTSRPGSFRGKEETQRDGAAEERPHAHADQLVSPPVPSGMSGHRNSGLHNDSLVYATSASHNHQTSAPSNGLRVALPVAQPAMAASSPGSAGYGGHFSSTGSGGYSSSYLARAHSDALDDLEDDDGIEAAVGKLVERAEDLCALEPWFMQEMQEHGHLMPEVCVYVCVLFVCLYM
jgi:hypothetical protein